LKKILIILFIGLALQCNESTSTGFMTGNSKHLFARAANSLSEDDYNQLNNKISAHFQRTLLRSGFYGQILIARKGEIIYEKVTGYADRKNKELLNNQSPMHLASASKPFTAMAVLYLAEKGMLSLDDPLEKFFPGFPYSGITISMLLSHRSGLPNYLYYLSQLKKQDTCYSNQDVLNSFYILKPALDRRPGTRFGYSNTNFVFLALIIEKVTGQSFPLFLRQTFFEPLGMTHTFVFTGAEADIATPTYNGYGRRWAADQFDCTYGDKNLYSTTHDMFKWSLALESGKIISSTMLDSAFTPMSNERPSIHNYGLGWRILNYPDKRKIIYHNGRWHGTNSVFAWLPEEEITVLIIGNKYNRNIYSSAKKSYDIFGTYFDKEENADFDEESLEVSP